MKKTKKSLLPGTLIALSMAATGEAVYYAGGRPMLFGAMAFWGLALIALVVTVSLILPPLLSKILLGAMTAAILILVVLFSVLELYIMQRSSSHITGEPETMVVLGANLWDHKPSPILQQRLNVAADYWKKHPDMTVVVTGGMGDDEPCSEAEAMAQALMQLGIPSQQIILEEEAANTMQNLQFSKSLLEQKEFSTEHLLVVSSSSHLARAELLAKRNHLTVSTLSAPVPGDSVYRTYFALREGAALVKSFLFDRLPEGYPS